MYLRIQQHHRGGKKTLKKCVPPLVCVLFVVPASIMLPSTLEVLLNSKTVLRDLSGVCPLSPIESIFFSAEAPALRVIAVN